LEQDNIIIWKKYDSFPNIYEHKDKFQRYCIDEAHNIKIPERYMDTQIDNDIEIDDDTDDEELSYMECIQTLSDSKRAIYISATLDKPKDGSLFYEYKLRQAINEGYLCDYQFVFPIFEQENVSNDHLAHYLVHKEHASHCVIYASSCKEGKEFTQILNKLQKGCAGYIDSHTPYKKRKQLFADFESGKIQFLINIRVLTEGFNAPHIRSIFFLRISTSDIFIIQVIGRALRLHQDKSIATIYFPFTQESDLERIQTFLHQLSTYDERINQTISEKKIGGYISIEHGDMKDNDEEDEDENIEDVFTFKYNLIVNSMGKCDKIQEMIKKKADALIEFVNINNKVPTQSKNIGGFKIGKWWFSIKQGQSHVIYIDFLSKNPILSADYDKTQKIREENKKKKKMSKQEKIEALLTFVCKNGVPKTKDEVEVLGYLEKFKVGKWWQKIKLGKKIDIYDNFLSTNLILSADYENYHNKKKMSKEEKTKALLTFVSKNGVPKTRDEVEVIGYLEKFKIGQWWTEIKRGQYPDIYKAKISENCVLAADYNKTQKIVQKKKSKLKIESEQMESEQMESEQMESEQIDYDIMTVPKLTQLCRDRKIKGFYRKKKLELISMLSNQDKLNDK
jgi:superfamily II DNA/RNA helicase